MSSVFANGPGNRGSIPGQVIPKTQKIVLDAALFNTQHYKVRIKGKVEQSREWNSTLPYNLVPLLLKRKPSSPLQLRLPTLLLLFYNIIEIMMYQHLTKSFRNNPSLRIYLGCPHGVMVKVSSYSSRAITFTFGQIPLGKVWTPLSSQLWVK